MPVGHTWQANWQPWEYRDPNHLFEDAYHLRSNPRFELIDYDISADRSTSPAPEPSQTQSSKNLKRMFKGVIVIDGQERHITETVLSHLWRMR